MASDLRARLRAGPRGRGAATLPCAGGRRAARHAKGWPAVAEVGRSIGAREPCRGAFLGPNEVENGSKTWRKVRKNVVRAMETRRRSPFGAMA